MTVPNIASLRPTAATGHPHAAASVQHVAPDAGSFTRANDAKPAVPTDQGFGRRLAGLFRSADQPVVPPYSKTGQELKTIENMYRLTNPPGKPMLFSLHGKPASLVGLPGNELVLRSKYSANPKDPVAMISFRNGKILQAKTTEGRTLTTQQQAAMVSSVFDRFTSRMLHRP